MHKRQDTWFNGKKDPVGLKKREGDRGHGPPENGGEERKIE